MLVCQCGHLRMKGFDRLQHHCPGGPLVLMGSRDKGCLTCTQMPDTAHCPFKPLSFFK